MVFLDSVSSYDFLPDPSYRQVRDFFFGTIVAAEEISKRPLRLAASQLTTIRNWRGRSAQSPNSHDCLGPVRGIIHRIITVRSFLAPVFLRGLGPADDLFGETTGEPTDGQIDRRKHSMRGEDHGKD